MIRSLASISVRSASKASSLPMASQCRNLFGWGGEKGAKLPTDEQQGGPRRLELDLLAQNQVPFNRDPIIPDVSAGTKENPILVPSALHKRVVGFEDPSNHAMVWFNLEEGHLHYVPEVNLYFKLDVHH